MPNPVHKNMLKDEINGLQVLAQLTRAHAEEIDSIRLLEAAKYLKIASEEVQEAIECLIEYEEGDNTPLDEWPDEELGH